VAGGVERHHLAASRLWAATRFPYLATALFACTIVESPGLGGDGAAVDEHWRLYVDPEIAAGWSVEQLGALLVHHTGHLIRDHRGRADSLGVTESTSARWALAADAELNDDLADVGIALPGSPVLPEDLGFERGRLAEEYYHRQGPDESDDDRDPDTDADRDRDGNGRGPDDADRDEGDDDAASTAPDEPETPPQSDAADPPAGSTRPRPPDHGSGSHGQSRPWELAPDRDGLSPHQGALVRATVANDIVAAVRSGQGDVPGNWRRWAEALLAPTVDWRRVLAGEVRRGVHRVAGAVDYSYRRRSRRASISPDVVLPALEKPVPEVAIVCDTSGSMGDLELARVLAEVEGMLSNIGLRNRGVRVLAVDAAVQTVRRVSSARQVDLIGGGGTDMAVGIAAAAALRPRPAVVVGLSPWPNSPPPGMRVVIGLMVSPFTAAGIGAIPRWARVVRIDDAA